MRKYEELKLEIETIIEIVEKCPDSLKEKCFEILLNAYIHDGKDKVSKAGNDFVKSIAHLEDEDKEQEDGIAVSAELPSFDDEIKITLFHTAVRRFLESNSIDIKSINKLYYLEKGQIRPLYEHLGSTRVSDSQIRLALLTAFENGYANNELEFNLENVRERCKAFKCYDPGNFMAIFKRNKGLFDNIDEKDVQMVKLSSEGKKELASVILNLSKGEKV